MAANNEDESAGGKGFAGLSSLLSKPASPVSAELRESVPGTATPEAVPPRQQSFGARSVIGAVVALSGFVAVVGLSKQPIPGGGPAAAGQASAPTAPAVVPTTESAPARQVLKPTTRCLLATWSGRTFIGTEGWQGAAVGIRLLDGSEVTLTSSAKFSDSAPCSCRSAAPGKECTDGKLDQAEPASRVEESPPTPWYQPEDTVADARPSPRPASPVGDRAASSRAVEYVRADAGAMCVAVLVGDDRVILVPGVYRNRGTGSVTIGRETFERPQLEMDVSCACQRWRAERGNWYRCTGL